MDATTALQELAAGSLAPADALAYSRAQLIRTPELVELWMLRAMAAARSPEAAAEAEDAYRHAQQLAPDQPAIPYNFANLLARLGRHGEAITAYRRSLALDARQPLAWLNLGISCRAADHCSEARRAFAAALQLQPDLADAWNNLGILAVLEAAERQAFACFRQALRSSLPAGQEAPRAAQPPLELQQALRRGPPPNREAADALYNLGRLHLAAGDHAKGWPLYEFRRWASPYAGVQVPSSGPWIERFDQLEALAADPSAPLLVWAEQGLGDAIQFCRYLALLQALGLPVVFATAPQLVPLMRQWLVSPVAEVIALEDLDPVSERRPHLSLMSLPALFASEAATLPATIPYLQPPGPPPAELLLPEPLGALAVGVVWSTSPADSQLQRHKSFPLAALLDPLRGAIHNDLLHVHGLQVGSEAAQLQPYLACGDAVHDWSCRLGDFASTAHLVRQLDLVITADTAMAHLAGALGIPTWVLLPEPADFRWHTGTDRNPWYPGMRLFRQQRRGEWSAPLAAVVDALGAIYGLDLPALEVP